MTTPGERAQRTVDTVFRHDGVAASYTPPGGSAVSCTVIRDSRDLDLSGLGGRPILQGNVIEVRKSEVAVPVRGGVFVPGTIVNGIFVPGPDSFTVADDPKFEDPDRLVWTMTVW